jgi:putative DNA primase/helicase
MEHSNTTTAFTASAPQTTHVHLTDLGNAKMLVARHGQNVRYVPLWGKWLVWDGRRWAVDDTRAVERYAKETVLAMHAAWARVEDDDQRRKRLRHALRSQDVARLKAMVELAKSESGIPIMPDTLDADPWLLNVQNGTLDLRTGELHPHRREDLMTKLAPVAYDAQAAAPTWEVFLHRIFGGDADLIRFVQKAVGYSLTGSIREQCLFILYGTGANGKSTFLNAVSTMLGEYASHTPTETLLINRSDGVRNDLARLQGARFVTAVEAEGGRRLAEAQVKQLTGGDKVTARYLYQEHFEFYPTFKLWLAVNHKPIIQGSDYAIWRRIRLIPFTVTIPKPERDKRLGEKLLAELPGILRWAVEGCMGWQQEGLEPPLVVKGATGEYRAEMDVIAAFIREHCETGPAQVARAGALYAAYCEWCAEVGETPVHQKRFGEELKQRGFTAGKHQGDRCWHGIGLRDSGAGRGAEAPEAERELTREELGRILLMPQAA